MLKNDTEKQVFNTDSRLAILTGWLILPAIQVFFTFTGALGAVMRYNPTELGPSNLFAYVVYVIYILLTIAICFVWGRRKRQLPHFMLAYYGIDIISRLVYIAFYGTAILNSEILFILVSLLWTIYFYRSKRVKATFIF
ncbi:DUF2569 family protein [Virgibacillus halophilus]|uniref:DUF2569 family protein n=1 Tax=Tigheibacillus halophilus TaxID=361280 RepID=A0ABU5C235_9BACI|nr:DUF2569 family protein [Virgibacillus halophilus]